MRRKRPIEDPPPASSTEVEEEEEEEEASLQDNDAVHDDYEKGNDSVEEYESEKEEEDKEVDSDAESDSDRSLPSPVVSDFTIKPIVPKKDASAPTGEETSSKRNKKPSASSTNVGDEKTSPFQRVWSEDDELAILRGMIEYKGKTGTDPHADIGGFHDFIKKSVRADVSQNQLKDKIRRLKKKYETNVNKGNFFLKPHDEKVFKLSKTIWGVESKDSGKPKKKAKTKSSNDHDKDQVNGNLTLGLAAKKDKDAKAVAQVVTVEKKVDEKVDEKHEENVEQQVAEKVDEMHKENGDIWEDYPCLRESLEVEKTLSMPDFLKNILREKVELIPREKVMDLERKWRRLKQEEFQLYLNRIELVKEQANLALDIMKDLEM